MTPVHRLDAAGRDRLIERLERALAGRSELAFAAVYGSVLEDSPFHDVDLAIWTVEPSSARLDLELAARLSRDTGLPIDVRRINDAPVPFLFHVLRGRILAVRDEERLATLMERIAREYHDLAPRLRRATREAFA